MTTNRPAIEKMVFNKFPKEYRVRTSDGTLAVSVYVPGKGTTMKTLASMTTEELFTVYRRAALPLPNN